MSLSQDEAQVPAKDAGPPAGLPPMPPLPGGRQQVLVEGKYPLVIYSEGEELLNRLTHGVGALLSLFGLLLLVYLTALHGEPWRMVSCTAYGSILLLFYSFSTIYHTVRTPRIKYLFRILDHASIFLLIAGTYTPFTLVNLRGPWGWSIFTVIWALAIAGTVIKIFMVGRLRILMPIFYIAMGWLVVVAIDPLIAAVPLGGIRLLVAGGIAYTVGVGFYAWGRLPYNHAIWHLFVLAGSAAHYLAILWYVVPPR